jgi:uncharacterized membrane protein
MSTIEQAIDVGVPVSTAYNQWTQFEEFPSFMEGVISVVQLDDRRLNWTAKVAGREKTWQAEIREQVPDQKIVWRSTDGDETAGVVTFQPLGSDSVRVNLAMSYNPQGFVENVGDAMGLMSRRVEGDLKRFKSYIEERGAESGGYRETLPNPAVPGGHTRGAAAQPGSKPGDSQQ